MEIRGEVAEVDFHLSPYGTCGLNSGQQAWHLLVNVLSCFLQRQGLTQVGLEFAVVLLLQPPSTPRLRV